MRFVTNNNPIKFFNDGGVGNAAVLTVETDDKVYANDFCIYGGGKCLSSAGGESQPVARGLYGHCMAKPNGDCNITRTNSNILYFGAFPPAYCDGTCKCENGYTRLFMGEYAGYEGSTMWTYAYTCLKL